MSTLAKGLIDRGHKIRLICNRINDSYLEKNKNVEVIFLPAGAKKHLNGLSGFLKRLNTDVVHVPIHISPSNPFL